MQFDGTNDVGFACRRHIVRRRLFVFDFVDQKQIVVVGILWRCQWWFWAQRLEAEEQKCSHQIWTIHTIFAHAQYNCINVQFLFGEFQQRDERLFRCLWQQNCWQCNVENVVLWIQNSVPNTVGCFGDVQLKCDANGFFLVKNAFHHFIAVLIRVCCIFTTSSIWCYGDSIIVRVGKINVGKLRWTCWIYWSFAIYICDGGNWNKRIRKKLWVSVPINK